MKSGQNTTPSLSSSKSDTFASILAEYESATKVVSKPTEVDAPNEANQPIAPSLGDGDGSDPIGAAKLREYFSLDPEHFASSGVRDRLAYIYRYVESTSPNDIIGYLQALENRIGAPKLGTSRIEHVYQYMRIAESASKLIGRLKQYGDQGGIDAPRADNRRSATTVTDPTTQDGKPRGSND